MGLLSSVLGKVGGAAFDVAEKMVTAGVNTAGVVVDKGKGFVVDSTIGLVKKGLVGMPTEIANDNDEDSILEYMEKGGRLLGVNYDQSGNPKIPSLTPEQREAGFEAAREFLNKPMYSVVNGREMDGETEVDSRTYHHPNPNDPDEQFGETHALHKDQVDYVMQTAQECKDTKIEDWDGPENLKNRIKAVDKAMAKIYQERHVFAGLLALAGGKSGDECYRDMQELFDFANNYRLADHALAFKEIMMRSNGDTRPLPRELESVMGLWQPFNFPCIGIGEMIASLIAGNTVVIHTSARMVGPYLWAFEKFKEAGIPMGRVHFVIPHGDPDADPDDKGAIDSSMSKALAEHKNMGDIYFTGSYGVADQLQEIQRRKNHDRMRLDIKLHAEAGGYNPIAIAGLPEGAMEQLDALFDDLEEGTEPSEGDWDVFINSLPKKSFIRDFMDGIIDSLCGLQGHKCSALHEIIMVIDKTGKNGVTPETARRLRLFMAAFLNRVNVGDVTKDVTARMGGLIDSAMHKRIKQQLQVIIDRGGEILTGNGNLDDLMTVEGLKNGMHPVMYVDQNRPPNNPPDEVHDVEIFGPAFRLNEIEVKDGETADDVIERRGKEIPFGLTSGVVAETPEQAKTIRRLLRNGVSYISGLLTSVTSTAAPAPEVPFGGSAASGTGSNDKKPGTAEHVLQFMRIDMEAQRPRAEWKLHPDFSPYWRAVQAVVALSRHRIREDLLVALDGVFEKAA